MEEKESIDQDTNSEEETSESSSDEEEIVDAVSDKDFFKTLSCLKNKDPSIYDNNVKFFSDPVKNETKKKKKEDGEKSVFVKDYVIGVVDEESDDDSKTRKPLTYAEEQAETKTFFKNQLISDSGSDDESGEELMKMKVKNEKTKEEEEADYIQFLKGVKSELANKEEEKELKPLHEFWNNKNLDENEEFLKDYILNRRYLNEESSAFPLNENLSDDERELEEQAEFEERYNRRFETEENLQIKRFPRQVEGSLRRKDDSRKKKRAEIAQRKKEEKAKKTKEIKKKQKEKLVEIEEKIHELKVVTGNPGLNYKDDDILGDFDAEKHDQKMKELFNEDYYNQGEEEHPGFNEDDYNWDYGDINMDCEGDILEEENKKLTRTKKKKLKKKKAFNDIMDIAKPSFDPNVHNDFKQYFDEYYNLDCEDFIDDLPCRFKYREVVPNDYGLSVEEILMADDSELNKWASVKKIIKRRPEHVEKNEVKIYSIKAKDENLKRKFFSSLYSVDNDDSLQESYPLSYQTAEKNHDEFSENPDSLLKNSGKKKIKKHKTDKPSLELDNIILNGGEGNDNSIAQEDREEKNVKTKENTNSQEQRPNVSKKKRKKKKSGQHDVNKSFSQDNIKTGITNKNESRSGNPRNGKKNFNSGGFKQKKPRDITDLSDNRLLAYGLKPKQFRAKMKYSKNSNTL